MTGRAEPQCDRPLTPHSLSPLHSSPPPNPPLPPAVTGEYRVERDCGYRMREVDGPCYQTRADDHIVDTCQCKEDACNGASAAVPTLALGLVALGVMLH